MSCAEMHIRPALKTAFHSATFVSRKYAGSSVGYDGVLVMAPISGFMPDDMSVWEAKAGFA
jgi:hypothetical protein